MAEWGLRKPPTTETSGTVISLIPKIDDKLPMQLELKTKHNLKDLPSFCMACDLTNMHLGTKLACVQK